MNVLILGAGGHGQVVADVLACMRQAGEDVSPLGYLDDAPELCGQFRSGLPVLGPIHAVEHTAHDALIIGIGCNQTRRRLYVSLVGCGERFIRAIHPRAVVARDAEIGPGSVLCANAVVNPGAVIGANVILNTGCTVDHHDHIQDHAHIAPGVHLGGNVVVGQGVLIGIGAVVMPQKSVGDWSVVGAGAVVTRDVLAHITVVGVPARPIH